MPVVSLSINEQLLTDLDRVQTELGFTGRSEILRAAIRLFVNDASEKRRLKGAVSALVLAIHDPETEHHVTQLKNKYLGLIHTQLHSKFKEGKCMELFILEGEADEIRAIAAELQRNEENEYVKLILV
jgi:CopG family nickel-responsive transcriptional regulator